MLARTSFLAGLNYSSLMVAVLAMCSGQSCAPVPTSEVIAIVLNVPDTSVSYGCNQICVVLAGKAFCDSDCDGWYD